MNNLKLLQGYQRLHEEIAICFGNFDGVHLGHQSLINNMFQYCQRNKYKSMVYTFTNHPMEIIAPARKFRYLQNTNQKINSLEDANIDYLCLNDFDIETMKCSPQVFLDELNFCFSIKAIFVGFNYTFGKNGLGNIDFLKKYGLEHNIDIFIEKPFKLENQTVSSTRIRNLIRDGNIKEANKLLNKPYTIIGEIIEGFKVGRKLGYPTANIKLNEKYVLPQSGVYATYVNIEGLTYKAITNVGYNPTFKDRVFSIETHILDFKGNLYGNSLAIQFTEFLREEQKFDSKEDLIKQIKKDINQVLKK